MMPSAAMCLDGALRSRVVFGLSTFAGAVMSPALARGFFRWPSSVCRALLRRQHLGLGRLCPCASRHLVVTRAKVEWVKEKKEKNQSGSLAGLSGSQFQRWSCRLDRKPH